MGFGPVPSVAGLSAEETLRPFAFLTVGIAFLGLGFMLSGQWVNGMTERGSRVLAAARGGEEEQ